MGFIATREGSATSIKPTNKGIILAHIVNNKGGWGRGFVLAVDKLSPIPKAAYKALARTNNLCLGFTQFVEIEPRFFVANMVAQDGYAKEHSDGCAVCYASLDKCLKSLFLRAWFLRYDVHMPAGIGSGLAGGDKEKIMSMLQHNFFWAQQYVRNSITDDFQISLTLWEYNAFKVS